MNLDQRLDEIVADISTIEPLQSQEIAPELAQPKSFLKILNANHYNWTSKKFRKVFGMRFSVKIPPIDQLNSITYPRPEYDIPGFIFFCLVTKRKVIGHLNVNCPFDDAEYRSIWVDPLQERLSQYESFECADRYPEWMKKYRNASTIYGMFSRDRLEDLSNCCSEYLDYYMQAVAAAEQVQDPARLAKIKSFQDGFVDDIRTQDKAQGMIAKMIGAKTAKRIFHEVTT
jgi:hypothetical protein